jgi:dimethylamine monooxygenase subunit A
LLDSYCKAMNQRIYLPFAAGDRTLKLGLKSLKIEDWIEIDDQFVPYLQRKAELLETNHLEVFASLPGSERAQQEILDRLLSHLLQRFPELYDRTSDQITIRPTNQTFNISDLEPLDLAGRLVQEDLCVMQRSNDRYLLTAASLCFPSRWRLLEKLGRPLVEIHQPVPNYPDRLANPVDQFFDRLKPEYPAFRLNWSIAETPELFLQGQPNLEITSENAEQTLWIRVERQTLRRFDHSILFGIRTYRYPIAILRNYPELAKGLLEIVRSLAPDMQLYKNIRPIREILLTLLKKY